MRKIHQQKTATERSIVVLCIVAYAAVVALAVCTASLEAATMLTVPSLSRKHSGINANSVLLIVALKYCGHMSAVFHARVDAR